MTSKILNPHWRHHHLLLRSTQILHARPIRLLILTAVTVLTLVWIRNVTHLSRLHDSYLPIPNDQFYHWNTEPVIAPFSEVHADTPCKRFPTSIFETVQIVLKTGMTDEPKRLLTHLNTVTRCIPNLLIVSDHDDLVNGHKVNDVLAGLSASYKEHNPDFATYYTQKELKESGNITEYNTEAGWKLDRFKFLPMVQKAYNKSSQAEWFVFIETDTYIFWDNLFRLLLHLNSSVPMYIGSPLHGNHDGGDYIYAYGGSGIVLSNTAALALLERKMDSDGMYTEDELYEQEEWMGMVKNITYGETVLGYALQKKAGVKLSGFYPMFHPLSPESLKFSEENLCSPIISMHKFWSEKLYETLWNWEMGPSIGKAEPILFSTLFKFLHPHHKSIRNEWNNFSSDLPTNKSAHLNLESCREVCTANSTCLQYLYHNLHCYISATVSYGRPSPSESNGGDVLPKSYVSGWVVDRIEDLQRNEMCEEVKWLKPNNTRHWMG